MEGQSLTEMRTGGGGGGNTNWKTLTDVKTEHLGHGEKVHVLFDTPHVHIVNSLLHQDAPLNTSKAELKGWC